jgi:hypothetical protein
MLHNNGDVEHLSTDDDSLALGAKLRVLREETNAFLVQRVILYGVDNIPKGWDGRYLLEYFSVFIGSVEDQVDVLKSKVLVVMQPGKKARVKTTHRTDDGRR